LGDLTTSVILQQCDQDSNCKTKTNTSGHKTRRDPRQ